jgi:hypothetical protein
MACDWYRKGKKHRVLVREDGKIIANNPLPLLGLIGAAAAKKAIVAGALTAGAGYLTSKVLKRGDGDGSDEGKPERARQSTAPTTYDNLDRPNPGTDAWYVEKALKGEF